MKRTNLTAASVILLVALTCASVLGQGNKKTSSEIKWVDIEKVCVEYEVTGMGKGKQKVYIGNWGNEHLTILDVVMEMGPIKQRTHTATYLKGNRIYTVDLETNKGTVTDNPMRSATSENQAKQAGEELGLTFINRGFDVRITMPFNESLSKGLTKVAGECVDACPTAALAWRNQD